MVWCKWCGVSNVVVKFGFGLCVGFCLMFDCVGLVIFDLGV